MRLVVPGASGFVGRNLVLKAPKDWEILSIYNSSTDFPAFVRENELSKVEVAQCDLSDREAVAALAREVGEFDVCVFLAANGDPTFSIDYPYNDLLSSTLTLLNFIEFFKFKKIVYLSSGAVYEGLKGLVSPASSLNPSLPYSISHLASEGYIRFLAKRKKQADYVILRFFGAFGPYEPPRKIYSRLVKTFYLDNESEFKVRGNGENYIDAMYIDDAVEGIINVIKSSEKNLTVDFCSGGRMTINQLVKEAVRVFGRENVKIVHEGETAEYIEFWASPEAFTKTFQFEPKVELDEGLRRLAEFLKEQRNG